MTDPYRYTCARCGSVSVKQLTGSQATRNDCNSTGWQCQNKRSEHGHTPVIWDKKRGVWIRQQEPVES